MHTDYIFPEASALATRHPCPVSQETWVSVSAMLLTQFPHLYTRNLTEAVP